MDNDSSFPSFGSGRALFVGAPLSGGRCGGQGFCGGC